MAVGLSEDLVSLSAYVPRELKRRMENLQSVDRHLKYSRQIEEALYEWVAKQEQRLAIPQEPTQHTPVS